MEFIGRKVYYEKTNGVVIWDKGEMMGDVRETTIDEDIVACRVLILVPEGQLGIVQFEYGEYTSEFSTCSGFRINPVTLNPEFVEQ